MVRSTAWAAALLVLSYAGAAHAADPEASPKQQLAGFDQRMASVSQQLDATASRLDRLKELVLTGQASSTRLRIVQVNRMGRGFVLERAEYLLNGEVVFRREDARLNKDKKLVIHDGAAKPGRQRLQAELVFRGADGEDGSLRGYRFSVEAPFVFVVEPGQLNVLDVVSFEDKLMKRALKDRLKVRFNLKRLSPQVAQKTP